MNLDILIFLKIKVKAGFLLKTKIFQSPTIEKSLNSITNIKHVLKNESIWLLMLIIMCAYVGYKVTDIYSL